MEPILQDMAHSMALEKQMTPQHKNCKFTAVKLVNNR